MRRLLSFSCLLFFLSVSSQEKDDIDDIKSKNISEDFLKERFENDTVKTYYDDLGEITNQTYAESYKLTWKEDTLWYVNEYDMKNQLQMRASYSDKDLEIKQGEFESYYDDGSLASSCLYRNGFIVDVYLEWNENGNLSMEGRYADSLSFDQRVEIHKFNKSAVFPGQTDSLSVKDGVWEFYHFNGLLSAKEEYDKGKLISANYFEEDGKPAGSDAVVEIMPAFPGGIEGLMKYLKKNIKYPKQDKRSGKEGLTMVSFVVNRDGFVQDAKVIKSATPLMDEESLRVVNSMPKWTPGKKENRRIELEFNLPIQFQNR